MDKTARQLTMTTVCFFAKSGISQPMIQRNNPGKLKFLAVPLWEIQHPTSRVTMRKTIIRQAVFKAECGTIIQFNYFWIFD
jgi:hypothetical protein